MNNTFDSGRDMPYHIYSTAIPIFNNNNTHGVFVCAFRVSLGVRILGTGNTLKTDFRGNHIHVHLVYFKYFVINLFQFTVYIWFKSNKVR